MELKDIVRKGQSIDALRAVFYEAREKLNDLAKEE